MYGAPPYDPYYRDPLIHQKPYELSHRMYTSDYYNRPYSTYSSFLPYNNNPSYSRWDQSYFNNPSLNRSYDAYWNRGYEVPRPYIPPPVHGSNFSNYNRPYVERTGYDYPFVYERPPTYYERPYERPLPPQYWEPEPRYDYRRYEPDIRPRYEPNLSTSRYEPEFNRRHYEQMSRSYVLPGRHEMDKKKAYDDNNFEISSKIHAKDEYRHSPEKDRTKKKEYEEETRGKREYETTPTSHKRKI